MIYIEADHHAKTITYKSYGDVYSMVLYVLLKINPIIFHPIKKDLI